MTDEDEGFIRPAADEQKIPDGTPFVIVDLDIDNEMVQLEFSLNGKVLRAWVPASHFQEMVRS